MKGNIKIKSNRYNVTGNLFMASYDNNIKHITTKKHSSKIVDKKGS